MYKEIWTATLGEVLTCRREMDNFHDRFAVAEIEVVAICSLFLRSGTIM